MNDPELINFCTRVKAWPWFQPTTVLRTDSEEKMTVALVPVSWPVLKPVLEFPSVEMAVELTVSTLLLRAEAT